MIDSLSVYINEDLAADTTAEEAFAELSTAAKTTWRDCVLHIKVSNLNTGAYRPGETLTLYYAFTTFTGLTDASTLKAAARSISIPLPASVSANTITASIPFKASGDTLYTWVAHEEWTRGRTIDASIAGIP